MFAKKINSFKSLIFLFVVLSVISISKTTLASTDISACGTLSTPGETYVLTQPISAGGDCLIVAADGIIIDGGIYDITGNINGSATADGNGGTGYSFTVGTTTVHGDIVSNGATNENNPGGTGGNGGNITLRNITVDNTVYSIGAVGSIGSSGADCGCMDGDGSPGSTGGTGGTGGTITIYAPTTTIFIVDNHGGNGGDGGSGGAGGSNSGVQGNQGEGGGGGGGGTIYRSSSANISTLISNGGSGGNGFSGGAGSGSAGTEYTDIPSVTITAPTASATISGSSASITATPDVFVGPAIAGVKFYVRPSAGDDVLIGSEDTSSPYAVTLDTTGYSDGAHYFTAVARNTSNYYATSTVYAFIDNSGPVISSVATSSVYTTTATVTWTTNEASDSRVWYGTSAGTYTSNTYSASSVTSHSVGLTGLTALTPYYFVVVSTNAGGLTSTSTEATFNTIETWTSRDSARNWRSITSSEDGTKLAATVQSGLIYTSTDSGATWTPQSNSGSRAWFGITSSSDGTKLAAVVYSGNIYTSTDSGVNWTARDSSRSWHVITSSSDGTKLAAAIGNGGSGNIYTSTNSGSTWTAQTSSGSRNWSGITSSSDGTKLAAIVASGYVWTSSDSGVNWTQQFGSASSSTAWTGIASSADGTKLVATIQNGYIYSSTDSGVSWGRLTGSGSKNWQDIVSSSDGTKLAATVGSTGNIYTSSDSGATWTQKISSGLLNWAPVNGITSSADGTKLAALVYQGSIYTSTQVFPDTTAPIISVVTPVTTPTNDNTPAYTFTTDEAGTISYGGSCTSGTTSATSGSNTISFSTLSDAAYSNCTITVTDSSNNASNVLAVASFTVDTTAPATTGTPDLTTATDSGTSSTDNITSDSTPDFSITCEVNATVTLYVDGVSGQTGTCTSSPVTITSGTLSGTPTITAKQTDVAGNTSASFSSGLSVTIDTTAPTTSGAPDMTSGTDSGSSSSDNTTSNTTPTFTGSCTDGTTVQLYDDGVSSGSSTTCASSVFSLTTGTLASGSNSITFKETDTAGNTSSASTALVITIDTTAPTISEDAVIATATDTTPTYSFTSSDEGTITYGGSCSSATTNALATTNSITLDTLAVGTYSDCTIIVTDTAGNASNTLTITSFTISAPASPSEPEASSNTSGSSPSRTQTTTNTNNDTPDLPACSAGESFNRNTGLPCTTNTPEVPGCISGFSFSPLTGQACSTNTPTTPNTPTPTNTPTTFKFLKDIPFGTIRSEDARQLQIFLNTHGFPVATTGVGSLGFETRYFGPATRAALAKFQKANNILPSVGYFGPKTRGYINSL